ncbi:deoxynucleoside triphosphate triphosphohydrolase SAMHD1-like isoform X2 [Mya arenaria]|uniref:deoxynucleoside triphosphate triphosphohydrolase SAMHD1-like isoform X2 n=1 Tax=Mya arenaria TaxID=6604 RepID=UPI0022E084D9|nr:deoxynucleoside triphosphate triphosphohydrolase SAMHD1-like isoform X2 [Mya arenaria]
MDGKQSSANSSAEPDVNVPHTKRICASRDKYWLKWDTDDIVNALIEDGLEVVVDKFKKELIVGATLAKYQDKVLLENMGIKSVKLVKLVQRFIENVTKDTSQHKVVNDPIHGHIKLHPLCVAIIDTPEFQRLRSIKQLGNGYFVYPGASHNRFEHSLGVCHLAGKLVRAFQDRQPELGIRNTDILCVEIAGLCHDLGHGPFSHLFDGIFIPMVVPGSTWKHEQASIEMFDYLVAENNLKPEFEKYGLTELDREFIKEQIERSSKPDQKNWTLNGRPKEKSFLYEVVSNKRNGIDVDKWDYFARDCHMLGIRNNFDHNRCIEFSRVISVRKEVIPVNKEAKEEVNSEAEEEFQICYRDKEVGNLYDMFHTRRTLHSRAYQHKTTKIIEHMVTEALVKADKDFRFDGNSLKMSESIDDMKTFSQMTDDVFNLILNSTNENLKKSQKILKKVLKRELYKLVGQNKSKTKMLQEKDKQEEKIKIIEKIDKEKLKDFPKAEKHIIIQLVTLDYGKKDKNPIDSVMFYSKNEPNKAGPIRQDQESSFIPDHFTEQLIRIYSKNKDSEFIEMVREAFNSWFEEFLVRVDKKSPDEKEQSSNSSNETEGKTVTQTGR